MSSNERAATDDETVWKCEEAYWDSCARMDLDRYHSLWHPRFVGWPLASASPVRRDRIADWFTQPAEQGRTIKAYQLERLASEITGDAAVVHYRVRFTWVDRNGRETLDALRITHSFVKGADGWKIIGGMSAPVNATGQ